MLKEVTKYNIYWIVYNYNTADIKTEELIESNKEFKDLDAIVNYVQNNSDTEYYDIVNDDMEILFPIASALNYNFVIRVIAEEIDN